MDELMLKINRVSKEYKLGQIGGTTLKEELQRTVAKFRHREDPTRKIGTKEYRDGDTFFALDDVSFEVKKGERVGLIGHNGAGKSTLLKLISRITAPSSGSICLNGRVASMLEVGTGFHAELTGRENVYMNGAILGMTKKEIDAKIEKIIDFSEVRQFIDTPVKRYSSGMYVKLAFSVAAHLDSEIMIMDEVLAVGDMAFQQKCLNKMRDVSNEEGRTILYVSHNMNTIRQLCDRVVVLDHGKVVFNGDVEEGIAVYMNMASDPGSPVTILKDKPRRSTQYRICMQSIAFTGRKDCFVSRGDPLAIKLKWTALENLKDVRFRICIRTPNDNSTVGTTLSDSIGSARKGCEYVTGFLFDTSLLAKGRYFFNLTMFEVDGEGNHTVLDSLPRACSIEIVEDHVENDTLNRWNVTAFGYIHYPPLIIQS